MHRITKNICHLFVVISTITTSSFDLFSLRQHLMKSFTIKVEYILGEMQERWSFHFVLCDVVTHYLIPGTSLISRNTVSRCINDHLPPTIVIVNSPIWLERWTSCLKLKFIKVAPPLRLKNFSETINVFTKKKQIVIIILNSIYFLH